MVPIQAQCSLKGVVRVVAPATIVAFEPPDCPEKLKFGRTFFKGQTGFRLASPFSL
jgi:hypothetical protein